MKETIIRSALQLFSKEGYTSTSMQRIAEECGISKASLYKYFDSKEELLIQVFEQSLTRMFQQAQEITVNDSLSNRERFVQKIILELEVNQEQRAFVNLIIRAMPVHQNQKVKDLMSRTKSALMNWHKRSLLEAYGEDIRPFVWDLVVVFQGTIREYIVLMMDDYKVLDKNNIAELLVSHFDAIVASFNKDHTVLTTSLMSEYETFRLFDKQRSEEQIFMDIVNHISHKAESLSSVKKREVQDAIKKLLYHLKSDKDERLLIEALCLYIDARVSIRDEIERITQLMKNRQCKEGYST
ncbi:TetR/AcrR family transcriptional regulator [Alkalihalobacillus sp. NPDC078783]